MNKKILSIIALAFITLLIVSTANAAIFEFKEDTANTVKIGYLPSDHDAALFVADAKGYFDKKNVPVDLVKYNNGNELMKGMKTGEIDVGYVGIAPALYHMNNGVDAKIISSAQNEGSGIVVNTESGISSVKDLQGKTIATPGEGTIQELLLSYYLHDNGISSNDVNIKTVTVGEMGDKLQNGEIDGAVTFQPYVTITESQGNEVLATSTNILPNHPCCVVVASDNFTTQHPHQAKKIVSIHKKATKYINNHIADGKTSEIVDLLPDEIVSDDSLEASSLESFPFKYGLSSNFKSNVVTFQDLEATMGAIENPLPQEDLFWEA